MKPKNKERTSAKLMPPLHDEAAFTILDAIGDMKRAEQALEDALRDLRLSRKRLAENAWKTPGVAI